MKYDKLFWSLLDELVSTHEIVIDRPKGSPHPQYSDYIYPLPMLDIDGNWYEYLDDFDCMSIDGVIYYMGEVYHA